MFERYTEKARRVIFFARYEASSYGSPYIETEHLLLGLVRENKALFARLSSQFIVEELRKQIDDRTLTGKKVSTSVDLPLSNEGKRVLAYAAEEAERLGHKHIGTEHLLLGLLREEGSFAAELLRERGLRLDSIREEMSRKPEYPGVERPGVTSLRPQSRAEGVLEFVGSDGVRIAITGISRSAPVPRVGELVLLELQHGQQRFRVRQVQYDYRLEPPGSPHAVDLLYRIRVYVSADIGNKENDPWSHLT